VPSRSSAHKKAEPSLWEQALVTRVNASRCRVLGLIEPWLTSARSAGGHTGPQWAAELNRLLDDLGIAATLEAWSLAEENRGDLEHAEEHRQVWRDVNTLLEDLAAAFVDTVLTVHELADVLESGLAGLTLGLVPPMIDQVLVGSIDRSRHPDIKAAILLGFNDGVFPHPIGEDSILNDDDRQALLQAGIGVHPTSKERILDERLLVYTALTRASDHTVVTFAAADHNGKARRPSPYVGALQQACPRLEVATVADPIRHRETWPVLTVRDLVCRLALEFRSRPIAAEDDPAVRGRWNQLYESVRTTLFAEEPVGTAMRALEDRTPECLSPASITRCFPARFKTSISQLESYAACPFQYFAKYVLGLREQAEAALSPLDIGRVYHAVLEDFVGRVAQHPDGLRGLSEPAMSGLIQESYDRVAAGLSESEPSHRGSDAYVLRRSQHVLQRLLRAQRAVAQRGTTRPYAVELPFGFDTAGSLPELALTTPRGRTVLLRGYIDRVDLAEHGGEALAVVIDYKRTPFKSLNLDRVYYGLSLQLPSYLLALQARALADGRILQPAAALYVSLVPKYERVNHPRQVDELTASLPQAHRPRGVMVSSAVSALDAGHETGGWSPAFSLFRKADGTLGNLDRSDVADPAEFAALLEHTRAKLAELADGILDGHVAVEPFRLRTESPCSWCSMSQVCRYEMGMSSTRFLEPIKRPDALKRMKAAQ